MTHIKDVLLGGPLWRWLASKFPAPTDASMDALLDGHIRWLAKRDALRATVIQQNGVTVWTCQSGEAQPNPASLSSQFYRPATYGDGMEEK